METNKTSEKPSLLPADSAEIVTIYLRTEGNTLRPCDKDDPRCFCVERQWAGGSYLTFLPEQGWQHECIKIPETASLKDRYTGSNPAPAA